MIIFYDLLLRVGNVMPEYCRAVPQTEIQHSIINQHHSDLGFTSLKPISLIEKQDL